MEQKRILITGGAGFIGVNAAQRFLKMGWNVTVLDNLSRLGGESNLEWLRTAGEFDLHKIDLRHERDVEGFFKGKRFDFILHCAGQVAVTTSVINPREDFECNMVGTFNLLEATRCHSPESFFVIASTNKVYGEMKDLEVVERNGRYEYADRPHGVAEDYPLDFHSPYGCSKGAADQYVLSYARIYGLPTVCFRQSCIYGWRQYGIEDQGWVAWFIIAHALGRPFTIYGDGKQTRDVLFIDDLVEAYVQAYEHREKIKGGFFNIGGGPQNQLSLLELIRIIEETRRRPAPHSFGPWRPGDQKVFVADIRKAAAEFGWRPKNDCRQGVTKLIAWVDENLDSLRKVFGS